MKRQKPIPRSLTEEECLAAGLYRFTDKSGNVTGYALKPSYNVKAEMQDYQPTGDVIADVAFALTAFQCAMYYWSGLAPDVMLPEYHVLEQIRRNFNARFAA